MYTDPIADMLTRIRNALQARHLKVDVPASRLKIFGFLPRMWPRELPLSAELGSCGRRCDLPPAPAGCSPLARAHPWPNRARSSAIDHGTRLAHARRARANATSTGGAHRDPTYGRHTLGGQPRRL